MSKARKRRRKNNKSNIKTLNDVRIVLAAAGLIIAAIGVWLATRSSDGIPDDFVPEVVGAPRVSVSDDWIDYGDVKLNTTIETVFRVRNAGDETLYIFDEPQVEVVQGC